MDRPPETYEEWRRCIEHDCGLELTPEFCRARITALQDPDDRHTARFTELFGDERRLHTIAWFEQAIGAQAE